MEVYVYMYVHVIGDHSHNYEHAAQLLLSRSNKDLIRGSYMRTFADSIAVRRMYIAETDWWEAGRRTGLTMGGTWKIH